MKSAENRLIFPLRVVIVDLIFAENIDFLKAIIAGRNQIIGNGKSALALDAIKIIAEK